MKDDREWGVLPAAALVVIIFGFALALLIGEIV
jgi:hypothetical protein